MNKRHSFAKGVVTGILSATFLFLILAALGLFFLQGSISIGAGSSSSGKAENVLTRSVRSKITELSDLIQKGYYEDVDTEALVEGIYKGMFESLGDPYSAYYTPEEYEDMMIAAGAQYYGIGAVLQQNAKTMQVHIVKTYEGTPAQEAGLKADDIIVKVEDINARSMELSQLVTHIRGKEGSSVHLIIDRDGEKEQLEFDVERRKVDIPTVDSRMLSDQIGMIEIAEFGEATAKDFKKAVKELQASGMEKMIVDLRDNPGGMLDSVTEILDAILPEGLIVYTEDKYGNRQEIRSDAENYLDLPMAVLINGNSASSSEIFAGAIRDHNYGTLIGTTTFGKGIVQSVRPLQDKSAVKLTTAKYFTPKGENIHGTGIEPDIQLKYHYTGQKDEEYDYMKDNQVRKAMKELNK